MSGKLLGAMAGAALIASIGAASAGERVPLTDSQLDRVVAGVALGEVDATNAAASATITLVDNEGTGVRSANVSATFTAVGPTPHIASVLAEVTPGILSN